MVPPLMTRLRCAGAPARALFVLALAACAVQAARIKDIAEIQGVRPNQLYGVGLVVGLAGSGEGGNFTSEMARDMLERLHMRGREGLAAQNLAAVMVTAELPSFARKGTKIDVTISALDDTESLRGGTLVLTPLTGADGRVYAVAQGPLTVGGFQFDGEAATISSGHPTVGRIPNGATVEQEFRTEFIDKGAITLCLREPDFTTASRMAAAINEKTACEATPLDAGSVRVVLSNPTSPQRVMQQLSEIEAILVAPDARAVVVINERTGTVVAGEGVSIAMVAVSHGNLTVITRELPQVSQPPSFSGGDTTTVERTEMRIEEGATTEGGLTVLRRSTTVSEVARALNLLGATPRDIIAIFQALKEAGALHAELRIM